MIRATFDALDQIDSINNIANRRKKKITDLFNKQKKDDRKEIKKENN